MDGAGTRVKPVRWLGRCPCVTLRKNACLRVGPQGAIYKEPLDHGVMRVQARPRWHVSFRVALCAPQSLHLSCSLSVEDLDPSLAFKSDPAMPTDGCVSLCKSMSPISCLSQFYDSRAALLLSKTEQNNDGNTNYLDPLDCSVQVLSPQKHSPDYKHNPLPRSTSNMFILFIPMIITQFYFFVAIMIVQIVV